jgi:hypothetical protein
MSDRAALLFTLLILVLILSAQCGVQLGWL